MLGIKNQLSGIDEIVHTAGVDIATLMDWILYLDFPAKKENGIWIAEKKAVKKWLSLRKPMPEPKEPDIRIQTKKPQKRRW